MCNILKRHHARATASSVDSGTPGDDPATEEAAKEQAQFWNWHAQNTQVMQGYPAIRAKYTGPSSLPLGGQIRETVSLDGYAGIRLWSGAEAHFDLLIWQGFGLHKTLGIDDFPNGEAYIALVPGGVRRPILAQARICSICTPLQKRRDLGKVNCAVALAERNRSKTALVGSSGMSPVDLDLRKPGKTAVVPIRSGWSIEALTAAGQSSTARILHHCQRNRRTSAGSVRSRRYG